jgi:hypothetical protein
MVVGWDEGGGGGARESFHWSEELEEAKKRRAAESSVRRLENGNGERGLFGFEIFGGQIW